MSSGLVGGLILAFVLHPLLEQSPPGAAPMIVLGWCVSFTLCMVGAAAVAMTTDSAVEVGLGVAIAYAVGGGMAMLVTADRLQQATQG